MTVYHTDDEAAQIWKKVAGLPDERIIRIATDDNFWMMGATGPCGPSSEIFYDHGPSVWGGPPGSAEEDGDRFIEIWNLVFMQNEKHEDGSLSDLPKKNIDTGMGLERFGALLQRGSHDVFETDTMRSLIEASAHATSTEPDHDDTRTHHRVIADHLRSSSFLVADGVLPSNEGRGYVLRRIMRRAMRHAHLLGAKDPVMYRLVSTLVQEMGQAYPELGRAQALISETLEHEETRFKATLERGLRLLDDELAQMPQGAALPGEAAFKLYDTYGFPLDLTQDALRERDREVDVDGFDAAMAAQKAKARAAWSGTGEAAEAAIWFELADECPATDFLGYDTESAEAQVLAIVKDGAKVASAAEGETVTVILNQTPFYGESGGQVGDTGTMKADKASLTVSGTSKTAGLFLHEATVVEGTLSTGEAVAASVTHVRRAAIRANHSATHLVHEALRRALGDHVAQRGSLVAPDRLRFDFAHTKAMSPAETAQVEAEVNAFIRQDSPVETRIMGVDEAQEMGARALFGEKYGDEVRVVSMGTDAGSGIGAGKDTYSLELCGGTHVGRTGEIGLFKLIAESASASGIRRIEGLTGEAALEHIAGREAALAKVAEIMRARPEELADRVAALMDERKALQGEVADLRKSLAMSGGGGGAPAAEARDIGGTPFLAQAVTGVEAKDLRGLIDEHKSRLGTGAVLLIADTGGKAAIAAGVTDDLTGRFSAVDLVRAAAEAMGGKGGGGRPDMAQGGGADPSKSAEAIAAAEAVLGG